MAVKRAQNGTTTNRQVTESRVTVGFEGNMSSLRIRVVNIGGKRTRSVPTLDNMPDLPGAVCKGHPDDELWFANGRSKARQEQAKRLCNTCPVKKKCLEYAMEWDREHPEYYERLDGIWGGTTEAERELMRGQENGAVA